MRLGIVADEFFSQDVGRMGGFGWAARQVARLFKQRPHLGVSVVFLAARLKSPNGLSHARIHDTPLLFYACGQKYRGQILRQDLDVLLTIDYRPSYRRILEILSGTPVIVWVRDPKPAATQRKIETLRLPDDGSIHPQGIKPINCRSLSLLLDPEVQPRRTVLFATPAPGLSALMEGAYGIPDADCHFLPNIVEMEVEEVRKGETPRVIFLGRLDPIKRPWLFVELARRFPKVEFLMLGQSHFHEPGNWSIRELPANVKLLGHVEGERKRQILSSAWVLANTSIHESLPTSFLESLACETPLLSCTNLEGIVSRFGIFTGPWLGDGMDGITAFANGLAQLIENKENRTRFGQEGRRWVERTHNAITFLRAFDKLCTRAGVDLQSTNGSGLI